MSSGQRKKDKEAGKYSKQEVSKKRWVRLGDKEGMRLGVQQDGKNFNDSM